MTGRLMPDLRVNARLVEEVLTGFIRDETLRTGRRTVVVGLSGGVDSALAACLARRALGRRGVVAALLPHRLSDPAAVSDARALARGLGLRIETCDVTPMLDAYFAGRPGASRLRRGNKVARERMSVLYDLSAAHDALVLGTSNKTELLLGYGTVHGDLACSINPLGDLYKSQVRGLAAHVRVPASIRRRPPSADLWPGQTDEGDLGYLYEEMDALLHLLMDQRYSREEVVQAGWPPRMVEAIVRRVAGTQFKRRPPLVAKISERTVGIDFRYPRDWGT